MAKPFNPESEVLHLRLPLATKRQIAELMQDGDETATDAIVIAIAERHWREFGPIARDVFTELDEIKRRLDSIEAA